MAFDDQDREEDWVPFRERFRNGLATLIQEDPDREFPPEEQLQFFEAIAEDYGPIETGLSMGWSMAQIDRFVGHPDRAAILDMLQEAEYESMERSIKRLAQAGNSTCIKLYAFCKMSHRGWVDRKEVSMVGQSRHEIVLSVRQALDESMRESVEVSGSQAIAALQAASLDEVIDTDVVE